VHHLANVNIATLRAPIDDPLIADFVAGLPAVNALADVAPGFVWRLQTDDGDADDHRSGRVRGISVELTLASAPTTNVPEFREGGTPGHPRALTRRREGSSP